MEQMTQLTSMCEMFCQIVQKKREEKRIEEEQAAKAQNWKLPVCCDDDNDYNSAITPNEPVDSLSMGDEHLNTIPKPNHVLMKTFRRKSFRTLCLKKKIISTKIDPHHFDAESDLIESMLNHDSSVIPSSLKINSLLDEFAGELTLLKSIPSRINETDCYSEEDIHLIERLLYNNSSPPPPEEFVSDNSDADIESFSHLLSPLRIVTLNDDDAERDMLIHEELLDNYSLSLLVIESYYFDIPSFSRPPAKPPDGNTGILNIKMMGDISDQKVPMPSLMITLASNQEKSPDLLSHRGLEIFKLSAKCLMRIHGKNIPTLDVPLFYFYPLDQLKYEGN
nr:hypothetical protein [Tanacetum cinerariifolium]